MKRIFTKLLYEIEKHNDTVLATIVSEYGSTPRGVGSMMLVGRDGRILGSIGGGALEKRAEELALKLLSERRSMQHEFCLRSNGEEDIGMVCGGEVSVLFQFIPADDSVWNEVIRLCVGRMEHGEPGYVLLSSDGIEFSQQARPDRVCLPLAAGERALIFGGGHIAAALTPLLKGVGFRPVIFDNRAQYSDKTRFPEAEFCCCGNYADIAFSLSIEPEDYIVVMTDGHRHDLMVEAQVLRLPTAYIGVIGSRSKTALVNEKLRALGISDEAISTVHTPVGLPIKAVTPEEIAVSIAAEMILVRAQRREGMASAVHTCPMH